MSWNGSGNESTTRGAQKKRTVSGGVKSRMLITVVVSVLAVVGAVVAFRMFMITPEKPVKVRKSSEPGQIAEHKPALTRHSPKKKVEPKKEKGPKLGPNQFVKDGRVMTRSEGVHAYYFDKKGRKILVLNVDDGPRKLEKSIFATPVEDALALYLVPGENMPPPPQETFSDEEVMKALLAKIEIDPENDSEEDQWSKQQMIALKEELRQALKEGETFNQFLRQLKQRQEHEATLMSETRKMVIEQIKTGDIEAARELKAKFNEHLNSKGLPDLKLPPPYRRALGELGNGALAN